MAVRSLRLFGRAEDLDRRLEGAPRPFLVTALLAQCSEPSDAADWWAEPVGVRIGALLRLAAISEGRDAFAARLRCPRRQCAAAFEITLPVDALDAPGETPDRVPVRLPDGDTVVVRPPTGDDQRRWIARGFASREEAVAEAASTLVIEGPVTGGAAVVAAIGTALAEHDPLVSFAVTCRCPECGETSDLPVDLEALALERLSALRHALMGDVHALAAAYGWTESEVLAIPPDRRARYRALIDGMAG
jgi:hypothetical protein